MVFSSPPVQSDRRGNTTTRGSIAKLSVVLSVKVIVRSKDSRSEESSMLPMILSLTSGKSRTSRKLGSAILHLIRVDWLGLRHCVSSVVARLFCRTEAGRMQGESAVSPNKNAWLAKSISALGSSLWDG